MQVVLWKKKNPICYICNKKIDVKIGTIIHTSHGKSHNRSYYCGECIKIIYMDI